MNQPAQLVTADPDAIADTVYRELRDGILDARYRPGHRLVEAELAAKLAVSRTPIREALVRLRQDGLVVQRNGWSVRDHEPAELMLIIEARASVESSAAYLAASRLTEDELADLEDLLDRMEDSAISRHHLNELNNQFHATVTAGAGNPLLVQFSRRTQINYWNFNRPVVFTPADDSLDNRQHRELVDALRRRDAEAAQRIAREHVESTARIIASALGLDEDR
jgi:DNA-binding GntR family transcriptional regulator